MAVKKTPYTTARTLTEPPTDLIPKEVSTIIVTTIDDDGNEGVYSKTYPRFALNFNVTGTRETEDLTTGQGSDITRLVSEKKNIEMEVNAYNPMFHAIISGQNIEVSELPVYTEAEITFDSDSEYTFETDAEPVVGDNGEYGIILVDTKKGYELQEADSATSLTGLQYYYDSETKTLTVSSDYASATLYALYYKTTDDVMRVSTPDTLKTSLVKIKCISKMQSASLGSLWYKVQTISRATLSGDAPEPPTQKDINQNMSYSLSSETPASGENTYTVDIYPA